MSGWPPPGPGSWGGLQGPPYSWESMNSSREGRDCLTKYVQYDYEHQWHMLICLFDAQLQLLTVIYNRCGGFLKVSVSF